MASAAERERARIMATARRSGTRALTSSVLAKLTPGQKTKLGIGVTQSDIYRNPNPVTNPPAATPGKVVQTPDGPRIVPDTDQRSDTNTNTATPPPPDLNRLPEDGQYVLDRRARQGAFDVADAGARAGEDSAASDYGINFSRFDADQFDAEGRRTAYKGDVDFRTVAMPDQARYDADRGFDTQNPFSRASLLNQAFTTNRKISSGSYANRGLLTSGAYGRAQYRDANRYQLGASNLQKEFAQRLAEYRGQRGQARSELESSNITDRRALVERALDQYRLNNPSA